MFVLDDCDVWAVHVLRPAVNLNMLKTKVAAARRPEPAIPEQWLVLCGGMSHVARCTRHTHMRGQLHGEHLVFRCTKKMAATKERLFVRWKGSFFRGDNFSRHKAQPLALGPRQRRHG